MKVDVAAPPTTCMIELGDAYKKAMVEINSAGIGSRATLTGVWMYSMSLALDSVERDALSDYLEDVSAKSKGMGTNADSPVESLTDAESDARIDAAIRAAEMLKSRLDPVLDRHDGGRINPARVAIETGFDILKTSWGGHHFRRILADQIEAVSSGMEDVVSPSEPLTLNVVRRRQEAAVPNAEPRGADISQVIAPVRSVEVRTPEHRRPYGKIDTPTDIRVRIDVEVDTSSAYATALTARSSGTNRSETRETANVLVGDRTGRRAALSSIVDALGPFQGHACRITVDTSSLVIYDGMTDVKRRIDVVGTDMDLTWKDVDAVVAGHDIRWTLSARRVDDDLSERTDRSLRTIRNTSEV